MSRHSLFEVPAPAEQLAPPCAICGAESYCDAWGHPLCTVDFGAWTCEPSVTAGAIGLDVLSRSPEEFASRAQAATDTWVTARKTARP